MVRQGLILYTQFGTCIKSDFIRRTIQMTDPIADMLTRIRNASNAKHETVDVPASNMKKAIADILQNGGNHIMVI